MRLRILILLTVVLTSGAAYAKPQMMTAYEPVPGNLASMRFCDAVPAECVKDPHPHRVRLTPEHLIELDTVNREVNTNITAESDCTLYRRMDQWSIPIRYGDCEDYALLKRRILHDRGWPVSALLMTMVLTSKDEGHMILTVLTDGGDFILDNLTDAARIWHASDYTFVRRQSTGDPHVWRTLIPRGELLAQKKAQDWSACVKGCQECRP
jgi:predicted transglutaminase-like cysteine proteinase